MLKAGLEAVILGLSIILSILNYHVKALNKGHVLLPIELPTAFVIENRFELCIFIYFFNFFKQSLRGRLDGRKAEGRRAKYRKM